MIILGLGSNVGDRLSNLRKAFEALNQLSHFKVIKCSPVYISDALLPENAPMDWDAPYLNLALLCESSLNPETLLCELKKIEHTIGRKPLKRHWGPREIDIDILAIDDVVMKNDRLQLPHASILDRPFVLWPMADIAPFWKHPIAQQTAAQLCEKWGSRFDGDAPFKTKQIQQRIDSPKLVGVVNITPDSFSDGGKFCVVDQGIQHAIQLVEDGAEILDIGAESTAPASKQITPQEEWQRLKPFLDALCKQDFLIPPKISIDTRHSYTAEQALNYPIHWINDVTGLSDPLMVDVVRDSFCDLVIMHHLSIPPNKQTVLQRDLDPTKLLIEWSRQHFAKLEKQGIDLSRVIFDPGIGFGKTPEQSMHLIKHAADFKAIGSRILIGHSRKSFLSLVTNKVFQNRDIETLALSLELAKQPIDYLRVHQVEMTARAIKAYLA